MPTKTKIEWADYVTNPVRAMLHDLKEGYACVKISEGCAHCWASSMNVRLGTGLGYTLSNLAKVNVYVSQKELEAIRTFRPKGPFKNGRDRALVFACDMTDFFGEWMNDTDIGAVFNALVSREDVDFVILTKRPERMMNYVQEWTSKHNAPGNIYLGASLENEKRGYETWVALSEISEMGFKTLVSYEPALDVVDWTGWEFLNGMICGGESGNQARPMPPVAARMSLAFCQAHGIPFFFKQWGEWMPVSDALAKGWTTFKNRPVEVYGEMMVKVGKGLAGHVLDGREWRQMP